MQVSPSQLIPGCITIDDVYGKTHQPILPKSTTVTEQHIILLNKFLISKVVVSSKLANGNPFTPREAEEEVITDRKSVAEYGQSDDFYTLYHKTVLLFKGLFTSWQGNSAIDISVVRRVIFPLIDKIEEESQELYYLYRYVTKEDYFYHHSVAKAVLSAYIAKKNNFNDYRQVGLAGFLADCGMAKVDYDLVKKEGPLTSEEYEEIKKHPTYSYRLVENISSLPLKVKLGILQHHERLDGSGYPLGVQKDKIHSFAACIAIADMYHAMTSERYYQTGQSPFPVIEEILNEQFGKYDPILVHTFILNLLNLSIGTEVKLSDSRHAEILFIDEKNLLRPVVRLSDTNEIISLQERKDMNIEAVLSF